MSRDKKVTLMSSRNAIFEVGQSIVQFSSTLKDMIEVSGMDNPIKLPNVSSKILDKVIEYCTYHVEIEKSSDAKVVALEEKIKQWDAEFIKVDNATLIGLVRAAEYLNIQSLLNLADEAIGQKILGKPS